MKKLICILISALVITSSFTSFATDIKSSELSDLKKYGIFQGDPDGNLRLGDTITRAEAVKMICTLLCIVPDKTTIMTEFPDVAPGHWATGYIDYAHKSGIIEGDDRGNFRPQDPVTNEEYIKMLVSALGFYPMAEQRGGFPAGFVNVAAQRGLTTGFQFEVNTPALRGDVALLTYRALDVPIMVQTGFGSSVEYTVLDGTNGGEYRTLRHDHDPEAKKNDEQKIDVMRNEENNVPNYTGEEYIGRLVKIQNLVKKNGGVYEFKDTELAKDITFVITPDTHVYISENTIPLSSIANGRYAQIWYTESESDRINVLKLELMEFNPTGVK